jgi:hypothetical protein
MIVHLFKCSTGAAHCLTLQRSGADLPAEACRGAWVYVRDVEIEAGDQRSAIDSDKAIAEIQQYGYHLLGGWYQTI